MMKDTDREKVNKNTEKMNKGREKMNKDMMKDIDREKK